MGHEDTSGLEALGAEGALVGMDLVVALRVDLQLPSHLEEPAADFAGEDHGLSLVMELTEPHHVALSAEDPAANVVDVPSVQEVDDPVLPQHLQGAQGLAAGVTAAGVTAAGVPAAGALDAGVCPLVLPQWCLRRKALGHCLEQ